MMFQRRLWYTKRPVRISLERTRSIVYVVDTSFSSQAIHVEALYDGSPPNVNISCAGIAKARKMISIKSTADSTNGTGSAAIVR